MKRRIFSHIDATALLRRRLLRADKELLILDSYFGSEPSNWDLVRGINVPVRVLTGHKAKAPSTPLANVWARSWPPTRKIPFHDRFYIWDSAGLNVGASASGLNGQRAFRIDELNLAEINMLRDAFARWWNEPDLTDLT